MNQKQENNGLLESLGKLHKVSKWQLFLGFSIAVFITALLLIALWQLILPFGGKVDEIEKSATILSSSLGIPIAILSALMAITIAMASLSLTKAQVDLENNKLVTDIYEESSVHFKRLIRLMGTIARIQLELEEKYLNKISNSELKEKMAAATFLDSNEMDRFCKQERDLITIELVNDKEILRIVDGMKSQLANLAELLIKINENRVSRRSWVSCFENVNQQIDSLECPAGIISSHIGAERFKTPQSIVFKDLSSIILYIEYLLSQVTAESVLNSISEVFDSAYPMVSDGNNPENFITLDHTSIHCPSNLSPVHWLAVAGERFLSSYSIEFTAIKQYEHIAMRELLLSTELHSINKFTFKIGRELLLKILHYAPESKIIKEQIKSYMAEIGHDFSNDKILDVVDDFIKKDFFFFGFESGTSGQNKLDNDIKEFDNSIRSLNLALKKFVDI